MKKPKRATEAIEVLETKHVKLKEGVRKQLSYTKEIKELEQFRK